MAIRELAAFVIEMRRPHQQISTGQIEQHLLLLWGGARIASLPHEQDALEVNPGRTTFFGESAKE